MEWELVLFCSLVKKLSQLATVECSRVKRSSTTSYSSAFNSGLSDIFFISNLALRHIRPEKREHTIFKLCISNIRPPALGNRQKEGRWARTVSIRQFGRF